MDNTNSTEISVCPANSDAVQPSVSSKFIHSAFKKKRRKRKNRSKMLSKKLVGVESQSNEKSETLEQVPANPSLSEGSHLTGLKDMNMECTEENSVSESNNSRSIESSANTNPSETATRAEKSQTDVIDLEEEEEEEGTFQKNQTKAVHNDKKEPSEKNCCECGTRESLQNAPVFVLTYYGLKYIPRKLQKVCERCFEEAMKHQEYLANVMMEHKPLLSAQFPVKKDIVVIQDSDEEGSDEDDLLSEDLITDIDDKLLEVIDSSLANYDLDFQVKESEIILKENLTQLEGEFQETEDMVSGIQKEIDSMRNILYTEFAPKIKELPPLLIPDVIPPPVKHKHISASSTLFPSSSKWTSIGPGPLQESPRRPPMAGVATKKVTQVQRVLLPGLPQIEMTPQTLQLQLENLERGYQLQQQEIVALDTGSVHSVRPALPPLGQLVRPRPQVGDVYYIMKQGYYGIWVKGRVIDIIEGCQTGKIEYLYKMKFENRKYGPCRSVSGKQLAYSSPSKVLIPVGTRVIALFQDDWAKECYYAGIVAEPPKTNNRYRYLVFFDDGYAQYLHHDKILVVCESSRNVWEDIHPESRDFIRGYLQQFPERPMVKLQQGQVVKTEWNGKWWIARVLEVDGSLVKMHFDADGRTELIYRGSTRLGPLYAEMAAASSRKTTGTFTRHRGMGIASLKKRNMPYVEYTRSDIEEIKEDDSGGMITEYPTQEKNFPSRAVAKKSTTRRPESAQERLDSLILTSDNDLRTGKVESVQIATLQKPKKFTRHQCGPTCIHGIPYDPTQVKHYNPLVLPQLYGWRRLLSKCRTKRSIYYRGPCGRRFRNMEEVHLFLRVTKSPMSVDQFDFDFWVHCFSEFIMSSGFTNIKDLSYGYENVPVPCVNNIDHSRPEYVKYSTIRLPMEGVKLNTDPEFLTCCDCTDDCQDKDKCACWQLTIQGTAYGSGGKVDPSIGYCHKRLLEPVTTGIYECNSRCKCANTCLNRVVQHPLQLRLQVFKTENRGWGIRCLNDVPQGAFICIYAGRLLTEQGANEGGKNYGDEYLAELDYIEVVERLKEGYESDVVEDEDMCADTNKNETDKKHKIEGSQAESPVSDDDDDGEASQDARDSDFELDSRHQQQIVVSMEESTIRTRLRNRKLRSSSDETAVAKDKVEKEEKGEKNSLEKDMKKLDLERKPSNTFSDDSSSLVTLSDDEEDVQRQPSRFAAVASPKSEKPKYKSVREYFGEDECCYIMDAKNDGNIGRYLNHSCSPNVFVQNVFVDTHDLRFPWVAFFALSYISAGTELTWDYNYDVGSVPGKVLHCYCGSSECRGRLL